MNKFTGKDVTVYISTKGRYFSTLPLAMQGIIQQTVSPYKFILWDDGEHRDLRAESPYKKLFPMLDKRGILWEVLFSDNTGQVKNHEWIRKYAPTELIWRLDDDNYPEPNCLSLLLETLADNENMSAVASLNIDPTVCCNYKNASGKLSDIFSYGNIQWCEDTPKDKIIFVDHLYSSFLYHKCRASRPYNTNLSRVGHREETMFTHQMTLDGWTLGINPNAITWHYRDDKGGIRSETDGKMWEHDENIFRTWIKNLNIISDQNIFWIVLENGLGDHYMLKPYLEEIKQKNKDKKIYLACCYPEAFEDVQDIRITSIAEAKCLLGDIDKYNIYGLAIRLNWKKSFHLLYRKMYLDE